MVKIVAIAEEALRSGKLEGAAKRLTARELDVLRRIADGNSNAEVAAALNLSIRTVETYRLRLMRKLGIDDLASLVKFAIRNRITSL